MADLVDVTRDDMIKHLAFDKRAAVSPTDKLRADLQARTAPAVLEWVADHCVDDADAEVIMTAYLQATATQVMTVTRLLAEMTNSPVQLIAPVIIQLLNENLTASLEGLTNPVKPRLSS